MRKKNIYAQYFYIARQNPAPAGANWEIQRPDVFLVTCRFQWVNKKLQFGLANFRPVVFGMDIADCQRRAVVSRNGTLG